MTSRMGADQLFLPANKLLLSANCLLLRENYSLLHDDKGPPAGEGGCLFMLCMGRLLVLLLRELKCRGFRYSREMVVPGG